MQKLLCSYEDVLVYPIIRKALKTKVKSPHEQWRMGLTGTIVLIENEEISPNKNRYRLIIV